MSTITYDTQETQPPAPPQSPWRALLGERNFRLLWLGEGISLLGDQFYMLALPWLVLQMTGDAFAMGTVLALGGIPRALFMVIGGALTDRFSPRMTMLASNLLRMVLVAALAVLVLTGTIELWMIYIFALVFGLADAVFFPAQSAIVPQTVRREQLATANAIVQGTAQISLFAGPVLAGTLIALLSGSAGDGETNLQGIGIAFAIDAITFVASAFTLWLMRIERPATDEAERSGLLDSIRAGMAYVWGDHRLRLIFLIIAASQFFIMGPVIVGIPVLADSRFAEGAAAYGLISSALGGGMLLGTVLAGVLPRPPARILGSVLFITYSGMGVGVALLGLASGTLPAALISLGMGIANGYTVIVFITWLQNRTPDAMLGRVMSLMMLATQGLAPVSNAVAGAVIDIHLVGVFLVAGSIMVVIALLAAANPGTRSLEDHPAAT